ncbi:MAG TPA: DUF2752 domain-containing protein [Bacteroidia bacterium]|nr:DUF2752 domain-containing protein [Bacteroidia bacterium]
MQSIIHWLENHFMTCPYKAMSGVDCPGCGMQRAFIELLKGNFVESFQLYPALLPTIFTLLITILHLIFKFKNGAAIVKYSFIITVSIVVISFLLKMVL